MEISAINRVYVSWTSMKLWVKAWLFWLNVVLLAAFAFLHDPLAWATLVSLPVTFVLLMGIALYHGGMVRILGLGHLIPWLPLLAYLDFRMTGSLVGPQITYAGDPGLFIWTVVLGLTLGVCLALDFYDVVRWQRGERFVLGSKAAHAAGASEYMPRLTDRKL